MKAAGYKRWLSANPSARDHTRMTTEAANSQDAGNDPPPLLTGHDLIRHRLATPGPQLVIVLRQVHEAQRAGFVSNKDEALRWVARRSFPG